MNGRVELPSSSPESWPLEEADPPQDRCPLDATEVD